MYKKLVFMLLGIAGTMLPASAQLQTALSPQTAQEQTTAPVDLMERINQKHPGAIKAKGLTPEQADVAAEAARNFKTRAPRKAAYHGPDGNQEFWFIMPEGTKLGYERGLYYSVGNSGELLLKAKDATGNMSARFNGALVDGKLHTIYGDLSWVDYGLVLCRDYVYDANNDWQLYKTINMSDAPYVISQEVAVDPKTHRVYGTFLRDDYETYDIAWVNYNTKEIHRIGSARRDYPGLGMNAEGRLFGVDMDGVLYEISLEDGSDRVIGRTGLSVRDEDDRYFMQSAECGVKGNVLYWAPTFPDGSSALYAVDLQTAEATKICDYPKYTLIHCLTIPNEMATNGAPAAVTGLKATFDKTATTGELSFTLPTTTYDGNPLTGFVGYVVRIDGEEGNDAQGEAGSMVTVPLTLAEGLHFVEVYASNSTGRSPLASTSVFVGLDQPGQVDNLQLTLSGSEATITWEPGSGANGGYPGELTYLVRRNSDGMVLARNLTETTFVDAIPDGDYRQLSYSVVPTSGTASGILSTTRSVAVGTPYEAPYEEEFQAEADFLNNFTVYDANNDGVSWITNIYNQATYAIYTFNIGSEWTNIPADDWLFTPGFALQAGKRYKLTFREACYGSDTQCVNKVEVKLGKGAEVGAMTTELLPVTVFNNNSTFNDVVVEFTAPDDDTYNVGFHVVSDIRKTDFILDMIQLVEATTDASPTAVANLTLTPGAEGALEATVAFTAPTKTIGGNQLSSLSKVRVMRNNRTIHTFEAPAPGASLSFVDTKPSNGYNTYVVVATNEVGDGQVVQKTGYVGLDIPKFDYTGIGVEDNTDHITVKWAQVGSTGLNGGYVDPAQVGYQVYNVDYDAESGSMSMGDYVGTTIGGDHLDIRRATDEGDQQVVSYAIMAYNEAGADETNVGATYGMAIGQPYALPFIQSASNSKLGNKLMWAETNNNASATYGFSTDSYDQDNGSFIWSPSSRTYTLSLNTGKISLAGSSNPKLMFAHKAEPGVRYQMSVMVQTPDLAETELKAINYQTITGSEPAWTLETIDLGDYRSEEYVVVKFRLSSNATSDRAISGKSLQIDAINVLDMQPYNLTVDIEAPESIIAGRGDMVNVVVHNVGERPASGYEVKLFADGEPLYAETVGDELASLEQKTVSVNYKPSVFMDATRATLRAEVAWLYDLVDEDNEMEAEVAFAAPVVASPRNATYWTAGNPRLTWNAPEQVAEQVTESFEGPEYTDFDLCGITMEQREGMMGDWTIWNLDGDGTWNGPHGPTGHLPSWSSTELEGIDFPNAREVCAWMVLNNDKVAGNMPVTPRTGKKMAATFDDFVQQDTWLISPELTGNEQTVTFYAAAPLEINTNIFTGEEELEAPEILEILVSHGGLRPEDFESLGTDTIVEKGWLDYEVGIEKGVKYFAIRNVTTNYGALALFVDDVTFERLSALPVSYNIYVSQELWEQTADVEMLLQSNTTPFGEYAVTAVYANGDESLPVFFADATGIKDATTETASSFDVYTLDGLRVRQGATSLSGLRRGIYVVNGRKVIVK